MKKIVLVAAIVLLNASMGYAAPQNNKAPVAPKIEQKETKLEVKIKSAIVRGNGDILPVVNTEFDIISVPKPDEKDFKRCHVASQKCDHPSLDFEEYKAAVLAWQQKNAIVSSIRTNLSGEAVFELPPGRYYIWGSYDIMNGKSNVYWHNVTIIVNEKHTYFELSNHNATDIINLK